MSPVLAEAARNTKSAVASRKMNSKTYEDRAEELFRQGYNCSQAVIGAFAETLGMDFDTAVKMATPFGGGLARLRHVCGGVSGMAMVCGMVHGNTEPRNAVAKKQNYELMREMVAVFEEENGTIICREALGLTVDAKESATPESRTDAYYQRRPCIRMIRSAARIAAMYCLEDDAV